MDTNLIIGTKRAVVAWVALAFLLGGCATGLEQLDSIPSGAGRRVVELIGQRLEVAPRVAWAKYQAGMPVLAPEREAASLRTLVTAGEDRGLDSRMVTKFFEAQMRASRLVQAERLGGWRRGSELPAGRPESLRDDLRPEIDRINAELLSVLPEVIAMTDVERRDLMDRGEAVLRAAGTSRAASRAAMAGVR